MATQINVLGGQLEPCSIKPLTGFYRTGCCETGHDDAGQHTICAQMTEEFLAFSKAQGNDLITPVPYFNFPGLKPGDRWCVCARRWREAFNAGVIAPVVLAATHINALHVIALEDLLLNALDAPERLKNQPSSD